MSEVRFFFVPESETFQTQMKDHCLTLFLNACLNAFVSSCTAFNHFDVLAHFVRGKHVSGGYITMIE